MADVAALYVRSDSVYKTLPGVDCWDEARDARLYAGPFPVVAHPPCRAWGRLRHLAQPAPHEKELARRVVDQVRERGGILEHPSGSTLWADRDLPFPGERPDRYGGLTVIVHQSDWGHRARKLTWLYLVRCDLRAVQWPLPRQPTMAVEMMGQREREATPPGFAQWLVDLARTSAAPSSLSKPPPQRSLAQPMNAG